MYKSENICFFFLIHDACLARRASVIFLDLQLFWKNAYLDTKHHILILENYEI